MNQVMNSTSYSSNRINRAKVALGNTGVNYDS